MVPLHLMVIQRVLGPAEVMGTTEGYHWTVVWKGIYWIAGEEVRKVLRGEFFYRSAKVTRLGGSVQISCFS